MAGNERETTEFLVKHLNSLKLNHLGLITKIESPAGMGLIEIKTVSDLNSVVTEDADKKADLVINGKGVSLKQEGGSFSFNRLQRANLLDVFRMLNFPNPESSLAMLDSEVDKFHDGLLSTRSRPWSECFTEEEFYRLTKFLMMEGSPNKGISNFPAEYIMQSPKSGMNENNIFVYTFDEYWANFKNNLTVSIRRQWYGQLSDSEHGRAKSLMSKQGNKRWVYSNFTGTPNPRNGQIWRSEIPASDRREVYFIMIEKH